MRILRLAALTGCLCVRPAAAQLCTGFAPFTDGRYQASAAAAFTENAMGFGAGFAVGGKTPFGEVFLGSTSFDEPDGSSFTVSAGGGYQFQLGTKGKVHVCPTADLSYTAGPNDVDIFGDGTYFLDFSELGFAFGVSLGFVAGQSPRSKIVPHASFDLVTSAITIDGALPSTPQSRTEFFGLLGLGVGIVLNRITLHPGVGIPIGLEGSSLSFGAAVGLNFGPGR